LGGHGLLSNELEIAIPEWLRMQDRDFYREDLVLVWGWDEYVNVLGIMLQNASVLEQMSQFWRCIDVSFNCYDVGNLIYSSSFIGNNLNYVLS
jgi:hypothetical protein